MATQTATPDRPKQDAAIEQKIQELRKIYSDAPEIGRAALDKVVGELQNAVRAQQKASTAGRTGLRQGKVSELTAIVKFAPGGAKRLRALLSVLGNNFQSADKVGTLHDMRFVFLDNDTRLLFATAYDGDWDTYIDDFVTKIPDALDLFFCNMEGYPGMHNPAVKDWIANNQITADAWYVASPNLTVAEAQRLERVGKALEEFLDKLE
ncbi:MAG TPA: hypothetical protein VLV86_17170 [Vicinamibacterales bacterium]|nr:hypothetical protein [Vicinamibacterales bacterium]